MSRPDYERAREYVLNRLTHELPDGLYYHGIHHTRDDVVPAVVRLAVLAGLGENQTLLLKTAALYHDIGYIQQYEVNEDIATRITQETLPSFGYQPKQIEIINEIILATRMPQRPMAYLEELLCDADMDSLGREDYFTVSNNLRLERERRGMRFSTREWFETQLEFLTRHAYFTEVARNLRDAGKRKNLAAVRERLEMLARDSK
jgi:uncharacterized protein